MKESQIKEAIESAFNNGHIAVSYIDVSSIVSNTLGFISAFIIVAILYKKGWFNKEKDEEE